MVVWAKAKHKNEVRQMLDATKTHPLRAYYGSTPIAFKQQWRLLIDIPEDVIQSMVAFADQLIDARGEEFRMENLTDEVGKVFRDLKPADLNYLNETEHFYSDAMAPVIIVRFITLYTSYQIVDGGPFWAKFDSIYKDAILLN